MIWHSQNTQNTEKGKRKLEFVLIRIQRVKESKKKKFMRLQTNGKWYRMKHENKYSICLMKHYPNDIAKASKKKEKVQCTNYFEFIPFSLILLEMADADDDDRIRKVIEHQRQINVQASGFEVVLHV